MTENSASNSVPKQFDGVSKLTKEIVTGLETYGSTFKELQNTASIVQKDLDAATLAHAAYKASKTSLQDILQPALRKADSEGRAYIALVKQVLTVHLGPKWNKGWDEAGLTGESIQTPGSMGGREKLLSDLATYFAAHPEHESAEFKVNAKRCTEVHDALVAAREAVKDHPKDRQLKRENYTKTAAALRKRVRTTLTELEIHLERDSQLWAAFGLTAPAFKARRRAKLTSAKSTDSAPRTAEGAASMSEDVALAK